MNNVFEHIEEPRALLAEVRRILKPNAVFLVGVPGRNGYFADPDHKAFYDKAALDACLRQAGFHLQHVMRMPLKRAWLDTCWAYYFMYGVFRSPSQP